MVLPDLAGKHCAEVVLRAEIAVPPSLLASLGRATKSKAWGRIIGNVEYGPPANRAHLFANVLEREGRPAILVLGVHRVDSDPGTRPRGPKAQTRATRAVEVALDRLGEELSSEVLTDLSATFHFPASEFSPAIRLPEISLSEGTSLRILGLRLGVGATDTSSIILDMENKEMVLVGPSLRRVSTRVSAALPSFALDATSSVAEKFVVRRG